MTSVGDSESLCLMLDMCPQAHGHFKKTHQEKMRKAAYFKGSMAFRDRNELIAIPSHLQVSGDGKGLPKNRLGGLLNFEYSVFIRDDPTPHRFLETNPSSITGQPRDSRRSITGLAPTFGIPNECLSATCRMRARRGG